MSSAIEFQSLSKTYQLPGFLKSKSVLGVEDFTLSIESGEIFGLLGLNGSGKTTSIRCLLGLIRPTQGRVLVLGQNAAENSALHSEFGYLPESVSLSGVLTPEEILTFFARLDWRKFPDKEKIKSRVAQVLEITGLTHAARRPVRTFSKGMTQRVGIAQAILHEPKILVLDEPASGLDPLGIIEMRELFVKLNRELKMTVLFSSHSIGEVERISNRVAIMAKNRLKAVLKREQWSGAKSLEQIFVETVR